MGGRSACLLTATPGLFCSLASIARPHQKLPLASEPSAQGSFWLALALSRFLCLLSLSVFKSHYMGFCSLGTSSSFQICPGTSGAVTGMLRTRSVDYRACTNERIQALLVSRGGIRHLPLHPLSSTPSLTMSPPAPRHPQEVSITQACPPRRPSRGQEGGHTLYKVGLASLAHPRFCTAAVFSTSIFLGEGFGGSGGGCCGEKVRLERVSNFEGPVHQGNLVEKGPFHQGLWVVSGWGWVQWYPPQPNSHPQGPRSPCSLGHPHPGRQAVIS